MLANKSFILFTGNDPWAAPIGGQSTFAKHMLNSYGNEIVITSYCNDNSIEVGKWIKRKYGANEIWFLSRGANEYRKDKKPVIPKRIKAYFNAKYFLKVIRGSGIRNVFIDSPDVLFAVSGTNWESVCYRFAGVNNPISYSRYAWAKKFGKLYETLLVRALKKINPETILASADKEAIVEFHKRTNNVLKSDNFHQFPTRVNTDFFIPEDKLIEREKLNLPLNYKIFVATGRISFIKGWNLLIDAFNIYMQIHDSNALLIFVGDGEDKLKLLEKAKDIGIEKNIMLTGFLKQTTVLSYMNAADVCLVGSLKEGWSLAMCEMISCGKAVVTTDVSGAKDMIKDGKNGYVVKERIAERFAEYMFLTTQLRDTQKYSLEISKQYAVKYLSEDLARYWSPAKIKSV
ncbi:glycosyltransferase family 4 protein [Winogradskyella sp. F6397]|uniref:Glycosyltransferase family 4 protein n=1 Tax=Winogradskyella marina TaxID=2785530 RepID=A0ABS0EDI3_9FLAO|nr:glycosyltransferase family 4 protein [Winogradskyella marina]MBF8148508.1 glycosyltransferase family 4 protein [Winogradskyella marina]